METAAPTASSPSLHPLFWVAGISVTLLSLAGIASLTGFLPTRPAPVPERPVLVAAAPAPEPAAIPPVPAAPAPTPLAVPQVHETPASKPAQPTHRKVAKKTVEQDSYASPPALPPPIAGGVPPDYVPPPEVIPAAPAPIPCADCGVVANVREVAMEGKGSGAGAIIGGLAGGALANNIGRGNTRTLATIAGAVGGGMLGNSIEKSQRRTVGYQITVRLEDGTTRTIASDTMPSWRIGDKVKIVGAGIVSR
jgi:outer membrane lipoprotein SlyB